MSRVKPTPLFIDGQLQSATTADPPLKVHNPATGEVIAKCAVASSTDVDRAVEAARRAFNGVWGRTTGSQRAKYLRALATEVTANINKLAKLETLDSGKPLKESIWDIEDVSGCLMYFAEQAEKLDKRQNTPVDVGDDSFKCRLRYDAAGVVAGIVPWNYPLLMMMWKVAPALAAGCTIVIKPSEITPLTALEFAKISSTVGLPTGVLNVVTGDGRTGSALVKHRGVDKVAFTGSVPTGVSVASAAVKDLKKVTLELGGKSPIIVFDDVDIDKAVEWVMFGVFWTNGQICSSTSRLLVNEAIAPRFIERLVQATKQIPIVNPNHHEHKDATGVIGPVVSHKQQKKILKMIRDAKEQGAKVLCGGRKPRQFKKGYFIEPTILEVHQRMRIWNQEVFGPVLSVMTFKTEDEAVALANASEFGLAGAVLSNDQKRCNRIVERLRCGITWVNCSQPCFCQLPWGGLKKSGFGRELGDQGIDNYLEPKQVVEYVSSDPLGWYPMSKLNTLCIQRTDVLPAPL